jgi:hypothetical protein
MQLESLRPSPNAPNISSLLTSLGYGNLISTAFRETAIEIGEKCSLAAQVLDSMLI